MSSFHARQRPQYFPSQRQVSSFICRQFSTFRAGRSTISGIDWGVEDFTDFPIWMLSAINEYSSSRAAASPKRH
jgi:hypothetical protein